MVKKYIVERKIHSRTKKRHIKEALFQAVGLFSIAIALFMLFALLFSIVEKGYSAFYNHYYTITIINHQNDGNIKDVLYKSIITSMELNVENVKINESIVDELISQDFINTIAYDKNTILVSGQSLNVLTSSNVDMILKNYLLVEDALSVEATEILKKIMINGQITKKFNAFFFNNNDSRYPETAGIKGAFMGSVYTMIITLIITTLLGIGSAVYLEEFTKKNIITSFIELNINNLAAIPSIVFGLLGLIVFQQLLNIPRATPILAGLVLALMALPTIIISTRIALSSVPNSIKEAAYGMGATKLQVIVDHMLPISISNILTGIIIAISRVIGETAPLMMLGMLSFINTTPSGFVDKATMFPVQILLWSNSSEAGYIEKASAAIILLLLFIIVMNLVTIYLRKKLSIKL